MRVTAFSFFRVQAIVLLDVVLLSLSLRVW
jgi:hypothetical protein